MKLKTTMTGLVALSLLSACSQFGFGGGGLTDAEAAVRHGPQVQSPSGQTAPLGSSGVTEVIVVDDA